MVDAQLTGFALDAHRCFRRSLSLRSDSVGDKAPEIACFFCSKPPQPGESEQTSFDASGKLTSLSPRYKPPPSKHYRALSTSVDRQPDCGRARPRRRMHHSYTEGSKCSCRIQGRYARESQTRHLALCQVLSVPHRRNSIIVTKVTPSEVGPIRAASHPLTNSITGLTGFPTRASPMGIGPGGSDHHLVSV
jgi:hypothetical protein